MMDSRVLIRIAAPLALTFTLICTAATFKRAALLKARLLQAATTVTCRPALAAGFQKRNL